VFFYVNHASMRNYKKRFLNILSCLVVISLVCSALPEPEALGDEGKAEESAVQHVVQYLKGKQVRLGHNDLQAVAKTIWKESQARNVDYRLVLAVIEVESGYRHYVTSPDGSHGMMQLKPATAREIAQKTDMKYKGTSDLFDPRINIKIGVYFLSKLIGDFKSIRKALYAYNIGPNRARKNMSTLPEGRDPHTTFTKRVMTAFQNNLYILPAF